MEEILKLLTPLEHNTNYHKNDICKYFNLPIEYLDNKTKLNNNIKDELDLYKKLNEEEEIENKEEKNKEEIENKEIENKEIENKEIENKEIENTKKNIYSYLFKCNTQEGNICLKKLSNYTSNNKEFIEDSQKFYSDISMNILNNKSINKMNIDKWIKFKTQQEFLKKYQFIELERFNRFNQYPIFLQLMTLYNLTSPLLQLLLPFIFLLIPFFIIKFTMKIPITFNSYKSILMKQLNSHSFGKMFIQITNPENIEKKATAAITIAFYLFSIYQNFLLCYKFYNNIFVIKKFLYETKQHLENTKQLIEYINNFIERNNLKTYNNFSNDLKEKNVNIDNVLSLMSSINSSGFSLKSVVDVGKYMGLFHKLYYNNDLHKLLCFTNGLYGFVDIIEQIKYYVERNIMNKCTIDHNSNTNIKNAIYPYFIDIDYRNNSPDYIPNDYNSKQNYIISGPNASGKTTYLKTIMMNTIFSQQFGFGFYDKATINPYEKFFSYINIPDTCGRDSLFQSEARRCLDIITELQKDKENNFIRSMCIFDELFSGTNPEEATIAGKSFLKYINDNNIDVLITTHYLGICKLNKEKFNNNKYKNYHLQINKINNTIEYRYKIKKGKSNIKGGLEILKTLNFPNDILDNVKNYGF
jgi:hypothetical protein